MTVRENAAAGHDILAQHDLSIRRRVRMRAGGRSGLQETGDRKGCGRAPLETCFMVCSAADRSSS